tara:strand:+ start:30 stop:476 length:447 start_codon:yes stop_codon:yes gene_type:complete
VVVLVPLTQTVDHLALSVPQTLHLEQRNTVTVEDGHKYVTQLVYVPTTIWVMLMTNAQQLCLVMDTLVPLVLLALYVTYGLVPMEQKMVVMIVTAEPTVMTVVIAVLLTQVPTVKISVSKTQHAQMAYKMEMRLVLIVVVAVHTLMYV